MNTHVRDNLNFVYAPPRARVYHNAAQAIANGGGVVAYNSERFDNDVIHDTATNNSRLTCKTAGAYLIGATGEFAASAAGVRELQIRVNGATVIDVQRGPNHGAGLVARLEVTTLYEFAVNDYVEVVAYQDSGGNLNLNSGANYTPEFWMTWMGN